MSDSAQTPNADLNADVHDRQGWPSRPPIAAIEVAVTARSESGPYLRSLLLFVRHARNRGRPSTTDSSARGTAKGTHAAARVRRRGARGIRGCARTRDRAD